MKKKKKFDGSAAVAWSVESLPSNPAVRVRFQAESGISILVLNWVCVLYLCSVLCSLLCVLLISVSLSGHLYFSYQAATELPSRDWVDSILDPVFPEKNV